MIDDGPVSMVEAQALVEDIRALMVRAQDHGQTFLAFALSLAAESVQDNVEVSMDLDEEASHADGR